MVGEKVEIVLLSGWIKDKKKSSQEEAREIARAKKLLDDYWNEVGVKR